MDRQSRRDDRQPGGWRLMAPVLAALALTAPALGADLTTLRGGFGHGKTGVGDVVLADPELLLPESFVDGDGVLVPLRAAPPPPFDRPAPLIVDVIEEPEPPRPNEPLADLPPARADASSILRIGAAGGAERVADGRVERPRPRPGTTGELPGGDTESGIVVVRQDLRDLITQVARFYGFEAVLSRQVTGELRNERLPSDFAAFIERLTRDRDLVFYFRDRELNASARAENVSRVIGLGPSSPEELRRAVEAAGVDADRFPLQFIESSNSVLVSGPPSFVGLVEVIAESLVRTDRSAADITVIRGNQIDRTPGEAQRAPAPITLPTGPAGAAGAPAEGG